jgi:heme-degrading monooxygenase HmoA
MTSIQRHKSRRPGPKSRGRSTSAKPERREWRYLIMWEFQVREGMEKRFEKVYGSEGDWARLFAQDESYIGTELIHHFNGAPSYATLDFWTSPEAYDKFRKQHLADYQALDERCEDLTDSEREIGRFVRVSNE